MTINAEIQKLEPGALVELFELDATLLGGDLNRFHSHTQYQAIVWQGNEYFPWPFQVHGFSRDSDKPSTPSISVGNVNGSISALCLYFDDLVGARVIRRRTLGKFIDGLNFPNQAAADMPFGNPDGAQKVFQLRQALPGGLGASGEFHVTEVKVNGVALAPAAFGSNVLGQITLVTAPSGSDRMTWSGSYRNNPECDWEEEMAPEVWYIERKTAETREQIDFELASALDFNGVMLPRRQIIANMCPSKYRGVECGYAGPPVADVTDAPTTDPAEDRCGKRLSSCRKRFPVGPLPYGGFPAAGLMRS